MIGWFLQTNDKIDDHDLTCLIYQTTWYKRPNDDKKRL